jgi:DNA-binding IclR family transcriptional regulator
LRNNRSDAEYEIGGLTKGIKVLEALSGTDFEPVDAATIVERTGFSRDTVDRCLKTLRLNGYAKQIEPMNYWVIGTRFLRLSERYSQLCLRALAKK